MNSEETRTLTVPRLFAIGLILVVATVGWSVLGAETYRRTEAAKDSNRGAVLGLWGEPQFQPAPAFEQATSQGKPLALLGSTIDVSFDLDQRKKGLLWFATYAVDMDARYRVAGATDEATRARMRFTFPSYGGIYDGFAVSVDGEEVPVTYADGTAVAVFEIPAGEVVEVHTGYRTNGLDEWRYSPTPDGVSVVDDFELTMRTDFADIDFPGDGVSPTSKERTEDGWLLTWRYDSLVTGRPVGLVMPRPLDPGPIASRVSLFAPVSLLFYFAALVLLTATRSVRLHPMNYGFLAAGFFAFHLLFAYLGDRIDIYAAFGVASVVSVLLCVAYLAVMVSDKRALFEIAVGQMVFLVLFSFSFFFEGLTGLAVTIGSVLTLAFFMAKTARLDWEEVFERRIAPHMSYAPVPAPEGGQV